MGYTIGTFKTLRRVAALIGFLSSATAAAQSNRFLTPGAEVKSAAGAGSVAAGPLAAAYNPAGLATVKGAETYSELSLLSVRYSFKTEGFDAAKVNLVTPVAVIGAATKVGNRFAMGFTLLPIPKGASKLTIEKIPSRSMSSEPALIDVTTENDGGFGYQAAIGASLTLFPGWDLGFAYLPTRTESSLTISDSTTRSEILGIRSSTSYTAWSAGLRGRVFNLAQFSLMYRSPVLASVDGRFTNEGGEKFSRHATIGNEISGAVELMNPHFKPFMEMAHMRHSTNTGNLNPMAPSQDINNDSYDVTSFVAGARFKFNRRHGFTVAAGWYPTSTGSGTMANADEGIDETAGIQFGDIDSISRKVASGGYHFESKNAFLQFSGAWHDGQREVADYSRGAGRYELRIVTLSSSIRWRL